MSYNLSNLREVSLAQHVNCSLVITDPDFLSGSAESNGCWSEASEFVRSLLRQVCCTEFSNFAIMLKHIDNIIVKSNADCLCRKCGSCCLSETRRTISIDFAEALIEATSVE